MVVKKSHSTALTNSKVREFNISQRPWKPQISVFWGIYVRWWFSLLSESAWANFALAQRPNVWDLHFNWRILIHKNSSCWSNFVYFELFVRLWRFRFPTLSRTQTTGCCICESEMHKTQKITPLNHFKRFDLGFVSFLWILLYSSSEKPVHQLTPGPNTLRRFSPKCQGSSI